MTTERPTEDWAVEAARIVLESLHEMVRSERIRRGLTHRAAAAEIGYSYGDLCRFEKGKKEPTRPHLIRMLRWLVAGEGR
jgi:ribosome-binding protein aMBF1 (putative translation factor)